MNKFFLLLVIFLFISSCATPITMNSTEQCASRGLKLVGENFGGTSAEAYNYSNNNLIRANSYSSNISCSPAVTENEKCEINRVQNSLTPIYEYNNSISSKRLINGIGYLCSIIPGIVLKIVYDNQQDSAIKRSNEIFVNSQDYCKK